MGHKKSISAVEDAGKVAARKTSEAIVDAAERLAPLIDHAGDYLGPLTDEARRLSAELAGDAYSRMRPVLRDAQIKGARMASDAYVRVQPALDDALHAVSPAVGHAVGRVRPVVEDVLVRIPPLVDDARSRVQDEMLPRLAVVLKDAAAQPLASEAAAQLALATAVVSKELTKSTKAARKRTWPKTFGKIVLAGAALAGVVIAVRKLMAPPSEGWHAHSPADAYVADPIEDEVETPEPAIADDFTTEPDAADAAETLAQEADDLAAETTPEPEAAADEDKGDDASPFGDSPFGEESFAGSEPPEGFVVKANGRTRKFRLPGSSGYDRASADLWFTTAAAAEAAGFTQAQR